MLPGGLVEPNTSTIKTLILSNCGMGPDAVSILAGVLCHVAADVVDLSENPVSGTTHSHEGYGAKKVAKVTVDTDVRGVSALGRAVQLRAESRFPMKTLLLRQCELGPAGAAAFVTAVAGVSDLGFHVDLGENRFEASLVSIR